MNEIELTTLNLTPDERIALSCALDICLESMKGSLHTWQNRESQLNPDETPMYPNATGNVKWLEKKITLLEKINKALMA